MLWRVLIPVPDESCKMKRKSYSAFLLLLFLLPGFAGLASAADAPQEGDKETAIRNSLAVFLPTLTPDSVRPTAVPGLYEVTFGSRLFYVSEDGRYLLQGAIFDLENQLDLTRPRMVELRAQAVEAIGEENMLIYEPEQTRFQVTVFTDIDCTYCRKMHAQMADYLARGIRFRYLFYPRAGINSKSYKKAVSVWCAEDRRAAMDLGKRGGILPERSCANPVESHLELGIRLGVRGTPAMVLDSGEMLPGYRSPDDLLAELVAREQQQ